MILKNKLRSSVAQKFVFYILIFSSFAAFISTSIQLLFEYKRDIIALEKTAEQIENSHKSTIAKALWAYDVVIMESQLIGIKNLPGVLYACIKKNNKILKETGVKDQNLKTQSYKYPLSHTAKNKQVILGVLEVEINLSDVYNRLLNRIVIIFITQILKTFFVSLFIFFLFYLLVGRHLKSIAHFAETIDFNNIDEILILNRKTKENKPLDELSLVETAFNNMKRKLINRVEELRISQKTLAESEERFQFAMQFASDGLFDWSLETNEIYYSPGWKRMLGYEDDELSNDFSVWENLTKPDDAARSWKMQTELINRKRKKFEIEFKMQHKDGHWVDILSRANAIFDENNKAVRIIGTHVDISERKILEQKLHQAQKMESIGRLAGGVAHDYNNISSIIIGYTELALDQVKQGEPLHEDLVEILTAAKRSTDITRQLLAFARKQTIAPKVLDLNDTISSMLDMLRRLIGEDINLAWLPGAEVCPVNIDPSQVDQILANLCVNARDAIADVGKVTVETKNVSFDEDYCADHAGFIPGEFVLLAVSDDGKGIAPDTLDKIFEPFFTTKGLGKGTGLGLSTVYGIAKQNNGFINVYSELDKGTTIKIYLLRHTGPTVQARIENTLEIPLSQGETVLLVEDDASILKLGKRILEDLGYSVMSATSPTEAIKLAKKHGSSINLLITDVVMPDMNGRELSEQLQSLCPKLKVLFMSGYTANVIAHRGVLDDGVNFISKPFSKQDMAVIIRKVLDEAKPKS